MKQQLISWTTSAGGAATVYEQGNTTPGKVIFGWLYAIAYLPGTTDTGATVTVTCEGMLSTTLLVKASAGTSNTLFYPRAIAHKAEDGAAFAGTTGGDRTLPLLNGYLKVVIASGGNALSGSLIVYYMDED